MSVLRIGCFELELDVLAHTLDDFFIRQLFAQAGVEAEPGDQSLEPRAAEDLLADGVQPALELARHRGRHKGLGYLLPLDQDQGRGSVEGGQGEDHAHRRDTRHRKDEHGEPLPSSPGCAQALDRHALLLGLILVRHTPEIITHAGLED